ncbi:hypothetical protein FRACYDRAFT_248964 [Fragilariopsis cylindrus CCMP1102]|uniref:Uncharacterized protein n=1 Tax=Fragilariopsis cylindrus CCMP1102 TaxID=635003 RepID=A0A1E7EU56_9STRA|nr:hypothetical protein FRACYDRAFT_248964 [Fragilariopsis cylindrus CCMP1102]|eukprot:OEU09083.1 hypothetical protein FRACYDRAFT_248964 [Fragilariopsis cylindrus CCMP1102]
MRMYAVLRMNVHRTETTPMELNKVVINRNYQSIDDTARVIEDSDPQQSPGEVEDDSPDKAYLQTDLAPQELMDVEQSDTLGVESGMQEITIQEGDDKSDAKRIQDGIDAAAGMVTIFRDINENDPFADPASAMKFFTGFVDKLEDFIPFGPLIGSSLRLIGSLFNDNAPAPPNDIDELRVDLNKGIEQIKTKIDEISETIGNAIGLSACNEALDSAINQYLNRFQTALDMANSEDNNDVKRGLTVLSNICESNDQPVALLQQWSRVFDNVDTDFLECREKILDAANGRLFYFRREYLQKIVRQILRAVQFDGICNGLHRGATMKSTVVARYVRDIQTGLAAMETEINAKMPIETIKENNPTPNNARDLYNTLTRDYSDQWSFGTYKFKSPSEFQSGISNTYNNRLGKIVYNDIAVFYKDEKISLGQVLNQNTWTNTGSSPCNRAMCEYTHTYRCGPFWNRRDCTRCQTTNCHSAPHQMVGNVIIRNTSSWTLYQQRGIGLVRLNRRRCTGSECILSGCNPENPYTCCEWSPCRWQNQQTGSVGAIYGNILTRFDVYERRDDEEGFNYALIGLTN